MTTRLIGVNLNGKTYFSHIFLTITICYESLLSERLNHVKYFYARGFNGKTSKTLDYSISSVYYNIILIIHTTNVKPLN